MKKLYGFLAVLMVVFFMTNCGQSPVKVLEGNDRRLYGTWQETDYTYTFTENATYEISVISGMIIEWGEYETFRNRSISMAWIDSTVMSGYYRFPHEDTLIIDFQNDQCPSCPITIYKFSRK